MFRNYKKAEDSIKNHYRKLRRNQTLDYVKFMHIKYHQFNKQLDIWDCFKLLENFIDVSDPDINLPNEHHLYQTAEAIRKDGHPEWLQVVGLIHDLGKLLYIKGCDQDGTSIKEQWGIVGDTFIIGYPIPDTTIYSEYNQLNPDGNFGGKPGIYGKNCGLDRCYVSYGHDEYLYQVLRHNKCPLPDEGYYIIRFHSLYPYHKEDEYEDLMNNKDHKMKKWLKLFNKYDLYSKEDTKVDIKKLKKYYEPLLKKYIGEKLFI